MAASDEKISDDQWNKLLDYISSDYEMRTNTFRGSNGKVRVARKWDEAAVILNILGGARKNGIGWRTAYGGLKRRAKRAYVDRKAYMEGTGGGESPEVLDLELNPVYCRCLGIVGTITATGIDSVADPFELQNQKRQASPAPPVSGHQSKSSAGANDVSSSPLQGPSNAPHLINITKCGTQLRPSILGVTASFMTSRNLSSRTTPTLSSHDEYHTIEQAARSSSDVGMVGDARHFGNVTSSWKQTEKKIILHTPPHHQFFEKSPARKKLAFLPSYFPVQQAEEPLTGDVENVTHSFCDIVLNNSKDTSSSRNIPEVTSSLQLTLETVIDCVHHLMDQLGSLETKLMENTTALKNLRATQMTSAVQQIQSKVEDNADALCTFTVDLQTVITGLEKNIKENTSALEKLTCI